MGAGRKVERVPVQNNYAHLQTCNSNPYSARHMTKKNLAGVIFGCTHSTYKECISKQLFGLPALHIQYVQNITPGLPLFLFNYSDRTLHGIFEATSVGQMYIDRRAWTYDGQVVTQYPAQVRTKFRTQCQPLKEAQYKPILAKNYLEHEPNHLWFELDQAQTHKLMSLFSTSLVRPSVSLSCAAATRGASFRHSEALVSPMEARATAVTDMCISTRFVKGDEKSGVLLDQVMAEDKENTTADPGKKWSSLFKPQSNPPPSKQGEYPPPSKECEDCTSEGHSTMSEDEHFILSEPFVISEMTNKSKGLTRASEATRLDQKISFEVKTNLRAVVDKLIHEMAEIKELHSRQTQKIQTLEQELEEANDKLRKSKFHHHEVTHSGSSLSASLSEETQIETQEVYQSILLVGGFDGSSWLQNVDCYCPFEDVIRPLAHLKSVRSYAAAVELDENVYILGGGYGSSWYDTVESYNLKSHQWVTCPSLKTKKGSLASASLGGKIFAIGGGDAADCFSEVEVLDMYVGKWAVAKSMMQKRFAPAAAELNSILYVAGGYDGYKYLSSVESFDPRGSSWTRRKSMNSRRGCHSLTVLNEKLYAIGGFDGTNMVPTVEMFEPRTDSWTMSEPLTNARGYFGSVNFGETIYAIGGMQENNHILDTVECYTEGEGWKPAQLKSMGKRCFLSAVTV